MNFSITTLIIIGTCLVSVLSFNNNLLRERLLLYPYRMATDNSYSRFITSGFVHADFQHLLFNMLSLYMIGGYIENWFSAAFGSQIPYICLYFGGLIAASLPDFFQNKTNPMYRALGASGAVSGIIFALIFFEPWDIKLGFFFLPPIIPSVVFGALYLAFSSYMAKNSRDNIGHSAHFWGSVWGFFFTFSTALLLQPTLVSAFIEKLTHPHF